jgi:hypothetical protein
MAHGNGERRHGARAEEDRHVVVDRALWLRNGLRPAAQPLGSLVASLFFERTGILLHYVCA